MQAAQHKPSWTHVGLKHPKQEQPVARQAGAEWTRAELLCPSCSKLIPENWLIMLSFHCSFLLRPFHVSASACFTKRWDPEGAGPQWLLEGGDAHTLCCAASRAASPPWLCPGRVSSKGGFGSAENRKPWSETLKLCVTKWIYHNLRHQINLHAWPPALPCFPFPHRLMQSPFTGQPLPYSLPLPLAFTFTATSILSLVGLRL